VRIGDHDVIDRVLDQSQRLLAGSNRVHHMAFRRQKGAHQTMHGGIVIHDEYSCVPGSGGIGRYHSGPDLCRGLLS